MSCPYPLGNKRTGSGENLINGYTPAVQHEHFKMYLMIIYADEIFSLFYNLLIFFVLTTSRIQRRSNRMWKHAAWSLSPCSVPPGPCSAGQPGSPGPGKFTNINTEIGNSRFLRILPARDNFSFSDLQTYECKITNTVYVPRIFRDLRREVNMYL